MVAVTWTELWSDESVSTYAEPGTFSPSGLMSSPESGKEKTWRECENAVSAMRGLSDDWDGLGAEAPQRATIDTALALIRLYEQGVEPPSRIVASPSGSVVLEWQAGKLYLEAEIADPYRVEYMLEVPGEPVRHWEETWAAPKGLPEGEEGTASEPYYPISEYRAHAA